MAESLEETRRTIISIKINGLTVIDTQLLTEFQIVADVDEGVPHGYFCFSDQRGYFIGAFSDLQVGSKCEIEVYSNLTTEEMKQKKEPQYVKYPDMYILGIEDDFSYNMSQAAGVIKVHFGHGWLLYKDVKNHCYEPMSMGDLVKKVIKSEERGIKFEFDDGEDFFCKTDDNGKLSRYKCAETDWDFLFNKIVPYCCSQQNPVHLFCTEKGKFYFQTYKKLFSKNAKACFLVDEQSMQDKSNAARELKVLENEGMDGSKSEVISMQSLTLKVSSPEINKNWFSSFYLEDIMAGNGVSGGALMTNKLKLSAGESFGDYLPLDVRIPSTLQGTSVKVVRNREIDDTIFLLYSMNSINDNMFELEVIVPYIGAAVECGDIVYVLLPLVPGIDAQEGGQPEKKKHWLDGKYIIKRITHNKSPSAPGTEELITQVTLIRSNFVGDKKSTSLENNIAFLYQSP